MTIIDKRIKVSLTTEEKKAIIAVADILKELRIKDGNGFIYAVADDDRLFYDYNEYNERSTVIEFLNYEDYEDYEEVEEEE